MGKAITTKKHIKGHSYHPYLPKGDLNLTRSQVNQEGFRDARAGDFRFPSNSVISPAGKVEYKSGYHESAMPTDTVIFLRGATDNKNGTHTLPKSVGSGSFWTGYISRVVSSKILNYLLDLADGFRTDTAQTILSAPEGKAAGHSGSGVYTGGQSSAHDLLRAGVARMLDLAVNTPGLTRESLATYFASLTVTSMAPAVIARTVLGGTANLKAGDGAKLEYEQNRNEMKRRTEAIFKALTPNEQAFVKLYSQEFLNSTQIGVDKSCRRHIPNERSTSPERDAHASHKKEVDGGGYSKLSAQTSPTKSAPVDVQHTGMYVTEPVRGRRRERDD